MKSPATKRKLTLAELEAAASTTLTVLLAFNHAAVASQIAVCLQRSAAVRVNLQESAAQTMQTSRSLSVQTTADHVDKDVEFVFVIRHQQRAMDSANLLFRSKVLSNILAVHYDFTAAVTQKHTCSRSLSSSCTDSNILYHNLYSCLHFQRLGILRSVRMLRTFVNLKIAEHFAAKATVRQHSVDSKLERVSRVTFNQFFE